LRGRLGRELRRAGAGKVETVRRVAISGVGLVTPSGSTLAELGEAIAAGRSAAAAVTSFEAAPFPTRIAAQVGERDRAAALADAEAAAFAGIEDWKSAFGVVAARR